MTRPAKAKNTGDADGVNARAAAHLSAERTQDSPSPRLDREGLRDTIEAWAIEVQNQVPRWSVPSVYLTSLTNDILSLIARSDSGSVAAELLPVVSPADREPAGDEVRRDADRDAARRLITKLGWKAGDRLNVGHSLLEIMVAYAPIARQITDRCGWPDCGCDNDARCNVSYDRPALAAPHPVEVGEGRHRAQGAAARSMHPAAVQEPFTCIARRSSAPEPQDCDWPVCGCDPYADKVIAALQESVCAHPDCNCAHRCPDPLAHWQDYPHLTGEQK